MRLSENASLNNRFLVGGGDWKEQRTSEMSLPCSCFSGHLLSTERIQIRLDGEKKRADLPKPNISVGNYCLRRISVAGESGTVAPPIFFCNFI
jgi:hypothetical protein